MVLLIGSRMSPYFKKPKTKVKVSCLDSSSWKKIHNSVYSIIQRGVSDTDSNLVYGDRVIQNSACFLLAEENASSNGI